MKAYKLIGKFLNGKVRERVIPFKKGDTLRDTWVKGSRLMTHSIDGSEEYYDLHKLEIVSECELDDNGNIIKETPIEEVIKEN